MEKLLDVLHVYERKVMSEHIFCVVSNLIRRFFSNLCHIVLCFIELLSNSFDEVLIERMTKVLAMYQLSWIILIHLLIPRHLYIVKRNWEIEKFQMVDIKISKFILAVLMRQIPNGSLTKYSKIWDKYQQFLNLHSTVLMR